MSSKITFPRCINGEGTDVFEYCCSVDESCVKCLLGVSATDRPKLFLSVADKNF